MYNHHKMWGIAEENIPHFISNNYPIRFIYFIIKNV